MRLASFRTPAEDSWGVVDYDCIIDVGAQVGIYAP